MAINLINEPKTEKTTNKGYLLTESTIEGIAEIKILTNSKDFNETLEKMILATKEQIKIELKKKP